MPYVTVENNVSLYYEELGSGDRYVICMQIDHDRTRYSLEREMAKRGYHVFLLTNRGFGKSSHVVEDHGLGWFDRFADDVIAFADQMGIDKFAYSGASHGSGVGWNLASRYPDRLVCVFAVVAGPLNPEEMNPPTTDERLPEDQQAEFGALPPAFTIPTDDQRLLERRRLNAEKDIALRAQPDYQEVYESPETLSINFGPAVLGTLSEQELQQKLRAIEVPILMLGGMQDVCSRPDLMIRSAGCLKHCKLVIHAGFGHIVDIYEDLADDAARFFDDVVTTGYYYSPVVNED